MKLLDEFKAFALKGKCSRYGCRYHYRWCIRENRVIIG